MPLCSGLVTIVRVRKRSPVPHSRVHAENLSHSLTCHHASAASKHQRAGRKLTTQCTGTQFAWLHGTAWTSVGHGFPPYNGSNNILLVLIFSPPPHSLEQTDQCDHLSTLQSDIHRGSTSIYVCVCNDVMCTCRDMRHATSCTISTMIASTQHISQHTSFRHCWCRGWHQSWSGRWRGWSSGRFRGRVPCWSESGLVSRRRWSSSWSGSWVWSLRDTQPLHPVRLGDS